MRVRRVRTKAAPLQLALTETVTTPPYQSPLTSPVGCGGWFGSGVFGGIGSGGTGTGVGRVGMGPGIGSVGTGKGGCSGGTGISGGTLGVCNCIIILVLPASPVWKEKAVIGCGFVGQAALERVWVWTASSFSQRRSLVIQGVW
ncbi:MAG: hypothetical protein JO025_15780 [Verrucomicrobia bacterium]|nr:hypothetical protein [Verrucomicrobiota bacterium]